MNNRIFKVMVVICLILAQSSPGVTLSPASRKRVVLGGFKGAAAAVATYLAGYALCGHDFRLPCPTEHSTGYAIATITGAALGSWLTYNYVPETCFEYATYEMKQIQGEPFLSFVVDTQPDQLLEQINTIYIRDSFPLVRAFDRMNYLYSQLEHIDELIQEVLVSDRTDLFAECYQMQVSIQLWQMALESAIRIVKSNLHFIEQYNAQTAVDMHHAQMATANAAENAAIATWVNAFTYRCHR